MRTFLKLFRYLVPIIAFGVIFYFTDIPKLLTVFSELSLGWILLLFSVSGALIYLSAIKWGLFIEHLGERISAFELSKLYLLGYFVNLILPSYLGGDAVRSWQVGKTIGQHSAAAATILERYTGLSAMVLLGFIFMWFTDLVTVEIEVAISLVAIGLVAITFIALSSRCAEFVRSLPFGGSASKHISKLQDAFRFASDDPKLLLTTFGLSLVYHCLTVLNTLLCAYAVGWLNPPIGDLFVVLPVILLIGAIPLSPNGLGIQDGAFFYFLKGVGATSEQALGIALLLRAKSYVLALVGGVVWFFMRGSAGGGPQTAAPSRPEQTNLVH